MPTTKEEEAKHGHHAAVHEPKHETKAAKAKHEKDAPQTHTVAISKSGFSPARLEAKVGDTVSFANQDESKHSIKFSTAPEDGMPGPSGNILKEKSFEYTFVLTGTYEYTSEDNPNMRGTIVVA